MEWLSISASPFTECKFRDRRRVVGATVDHFRCPLVYVNMVGGQDELIFDGGSFALNAEENSSPNACASTKISTFWICRKKTAPC